MFEVIIKKKYIETKFTFRYICIFFIFWDFIKATRIPIWIISLTIVSLNLLFYLSSHTFSAFRISYLNMFTRSSDRIFNRMRYTGEWEYVNVKYLQEKLWMQKQSPNWVTSTLFVTCPSVVPYHICFFMTLEIISGDSCKFILFSNLLTNQIYIIHD